MSFDPVPAQRSSRPRPAASTGERLGAGAAAAAELMRSRELYPSRRLLPEQRELREVVRAQQYVGRLLEPLERAGATTLHARRAPGTAFELDHVVVTTGAVLVLVDVVSTRRAPVVIDDFGSLARAGLPLARRQDLLRAAAEDIASECGRHLPTAWTVLVVPVMAVVGSCGLRAPVVSRGLSVVQDDLLQQWATETFPPTVDLVGAAQIAAAVEQTCPVTR